ncbi:unnamed protein product [Cyprideis torosa]|uniref:MARVEL domain-containing protein n=1 Tax=Cyprideis torosa TaxID=163714 RepID=A0A7R8WDR7_9CRUS|nr:unnamed protein product [Cyprideis torosa]CAG0894933.1 unnamed protein product [Cyprideis torosa]
MACDGKLLITPNGILKLIELVLGCIILGLYVAEPMGMYQIPQDNATNRDRPLRLPWDRLYMTIFGGYIFIITGFIASYSYGTKLKLPELFLSLLGGCFYFVCSVSLLVFATRDRPNNLPNDTEYERTQTFAKASGSLALFQSIAYFIDLVFLAMDTKSEQKPQMTMSMINTPQGVLKFLEILFAAICLAVYVREPMGIAIEGDTLQNVIVNGYPWPWDRLYMSVFGGFVFIISGYLIAYAYGFKTMLPEVYHSVVGAAFYFTCGVSLLVFASRELSNDAERFHVFGKAVGSFAILQTVAYVIDAVFGFLDKPTKILNF